MKKEQQMHQASLAIGNTDIVIQTDNKALYNRAKQRLFLQAPRKNKTQHFITFIQDNAVDELIKKTIAVNAVHVEKKINTQGSTSWLMKVFNEFCVEIYVKDNNQVEVRYSQKASLSYLLDDVLQATLDDVLKHQGGFILHGACLVKENKAIALIGPSGSGKSTSAFNLMRGGYTCYADDAVIVTQENGKLFVWPFSKELSIRPLSYNLLKRQGIEYKDYRHEGRKYYFSQKTSNRLNGVPLVAICLIKVAGDKETIHSEINDAELKRYLNAETKYFSFINREQHTKYISQICQNDNAYYISQMGNDLNRQIESIDALLNMKSNGHEYNNNDKTLDHTLGHTIMSRKEKMHVIKTAWQNENNVPIEALLPFLSDSDLLVYENTLAFLQNYHLAQITLLNEKVESININDLPEWIKAASWQKGAKQLAQNISEEMLTEYSIGWLTSAPILYFYLRQNLPEDKKIKLDTCWLKARKNIDNIIALKNSAKQFKSLETYILNSHESGKASNNEQELEYIDIVLTVYSEELKQERLCHALIDFLTKTKKRVFIKTNIDGIKIMPISIVNAAFKQNPYVFSIN